MIAPGNITPKDRHAVPLLLLLVCSVAAIFPLLLHGPSCGHDFDFHLLSWIETAHDWHHGLLNPQWLVTANYGAGEPRFVFYPPLSWMLGALFGASVSLITGQVAGWTMAPVLLTFLAVFGAGICVYRLALSLTSKRPALIAACLFIANPYLLFVAYERTAYGELLSTGIIALLLLFALRRTIPIVAVALVIGALWLTNAPAAVMGCYTLAFITLGRMILERRWSHAWRAAVACVMGLALAAFYLVPAAWEQRWVQISRAIGSGMRVEDSFLFSHIGEALHDQVLHTASMMVVLFCALGFAGFALARIRGRRDTSIFVLGALLAVILLLQFPFSTRIWHAAPHLAFLQFPWRWLLVASIVAACLLAMALSAGTSRKSSSLVEVCVTLLIVGGSIGYGSHQYSQPCDEQDRIPGQLAAFHSGAGVEGTDEYTALGADNSAIFQDLPQVRLLTIPDAEEPASEAGDNPEWPGYSEGIIDQAAGSIAVRQWEPESREIAVDLKQPAFVVPALMDYPAWRVTVNGLPVVNRPHREDGLMAVPVPAGPSTIAIRWSTTPDVRWGRAISLAALLLMMMGLFMRRFMRAGTSR